MRRILCRCCGSVSGLGIPRRVCGMPLGGLGVLDRSLVGVCARCNIDRARRRCGGGGGGIFVVGEARDDARDDATMAVDRASSLMPLDSSMRLELLVLCDSPDTDAKLGVDRSDVLGLRRDPRERWTSPARGEA